MMPRSKAAQQVKFVQWQPGDVTLCVEGEEELLTRQQFEAKLVVARKLFSLNAGDYWNDKTDEYIHHMILRADAVFWAAASIEAAHGAFDTLPVGVELMGSFAKVGEKA